MTQLYITLKEQKEVRRTSNGKDYEQDSEGHYVYDLMTPLGYAAEYRKDNDKTEKKNAAQRTWAYSYHTVKDDLVYAIQRRWTHNPGRQATCEETYSVAKLQPMIIDNVALEGFTIAKTVSRSSTSNKLWRILDPRGFELEISTANMEDILMNGTVKNGELIGSYIWDFGKTGIGKAHLIKAKS